MQQNLFLRNKNILNFLSETEILLGVGEFLKQY